MIGIKYEGRLGNCLFQYAAARVFANKFGIGVFRESNNYLLRLAGSLPNYIIGVDENKGTLVVLNDENFFRYLESEKIPDSDFLIGSGMQNPEFIEKCLGEIISTVRTEDLEQEKNSLLVHVRLGDCDGSPRRLPYGYYHDALKNSQFSTGYICSDSIEHPDVKSLIREFDLIPYNLSAPDTLRSSKKFDKMILSEGTFSWWLGVLSNASEIIINKRTRQHQWHGDIFVFPDWKQTNYCS